MRGCLQAEPIAEHSLWRCRLQLLFCSLGKAIIKCLGETVCAARREVSKYV